jgi:hypothetical protein
MGSRLHPIRAAHPPPPGATDDVLEQAIGASHRRAVLATDWVDETAVMRPGVEVVLIRATDGGDGAMRLVRYLARLEDPPRIVVVGDRRTGPTEALAAGADAWIDQRAELDTVLVAMHGRPRPPATPRRRRWWRR